MNIINLTRDTESTRFANPREGEPVVRYRSLPHLGKIHNGDAVQCSRYIKYKYIINEKVIGLLYCYQPSFL